MPPFDEPVFNAYAACTIASVIVALISNAQKRSHARYVKTFIGCDTITEAQELLNDGGLREYAGGGGQRTYDAILIRQCFAWVCTAGLFGGYLLMYIIALLR